MKKKLKQIPKTLFLCLIVFFTSCNKDELYEADNLSKTKATSRFVTFNELKKNQKAFGEFQEVEQKVSLAKSSSQAGLSSRLVYLSQYNFSIDTDKILLVEKGDYKSYTFPIYRDEETEKTENLVITQKNSEVNAYLSKYTLTELEKQKIENFEYVDLYNKTEISKLQNQTQSEPCYEIVSTPVAWNSQGQVTHSLVTIEEVDCPDEGGGSSGGGGGGGGSGGGGWSDGGSWGGGGSGGGWSGGGGSTGGGSTGGGSTGGGGYTGGGSGSGGPNPGNYQDPSLTDWDGSSIVTYPVLPDPETIQEHFDSLNEMTNDDTKPYKAKVQVLQQTLNQTIETGFEFRTDPNNPDIILPAINVSSGPTGVKFGIPLVNSIIRMHNHHNGLDPVFSAEDVAGMAEFFVVKDDLGAEDALDITSLLISRSGAFALKIDDPDKAFSFYQDIKYGTSMDINGNRIKTLKIFFNSYVTDVITESQKQCNGTCSDEGYNDFLMNNFNTWLNSWDTGFGYYYGSLNSDNTYTWNRLN